MPRINRQHSQKNSIEAKSDTGKTASIASLIILVTGITAVAALQRP